MEKVNLNFNGRENIIKSIFWLLSILSWLFFLITGWVSVFGNYLYFWAIQKNAYILLFGYVYIPSQIEETMLKIIFILTLAISTAGFCAYLVYSTYLKSNVFNGMMGFISKFHFIPFACGGVLFLIGENIDLKNAKGLLIIALLFSIIGFISLILVHFKTNINPWYASLKIKKASFSCLIALFTYSIFYTAYQVGLYNIIENYSIYEIMAILIGKKRKNNKFY